MPHSDTKYERPEVLAVPEKSVSALFRRAAFHSDPITICMVLDAIAKDGRYLDRELAEQNPCFKQVVAYGIVRHKSNVLCLRRTRKSHRKSLRLRYTLLFGGHVDDSEKHTQEPLQSCLLRELNEELGISPSRPLELLGIVTDPTTLVGQLHIGIVFDVHTEHDVIDVPTSLDNAEFVNAEKNNRYQLQQVDKLPKKRFDSWSTLFLASDVCERILGKRRTFHEQLMLPFE